MTFLPKVDEAPFTLLSVLGLGRGSWRLLLVAPESEPAGIFLGPMTALRLQGHSMVLEGH